MKVKKFYGIDNHDVIRKVRNELGSDAVILHQRKVKPKGVFGFLKKSMVEVVAAIEEREVQTTNANNIHMAKIQEIDLRERSALKSKDTELKKEINDIKSMLGNVVNQIQNINSLNQMDEEDRIKNNYLYKLLQENELDEELIMDVLNNHYDEINLLDIENKEEVKNFLARIIPNAINDKKIDITSKVVFFVGPTGVGKTTTIAKIAANYKLEKGLSVGLISADTYRIAAVEQLKVYSDILNIPLEVIYSPKEVHRALKSLENMDIVMIDTAGRSHKNIEQIDELKCLLNEVENKNVYLVISSTTKSSDLKDIIKTYDFIDNYKIIFTKLDEVSTYGPILSTAIKDPECISYVTTGQSVPDDIEVVTSNKILDMLLKEI